jgi:hypothetical protein
MSSHHKIQLPKRTPPFWPGASSPVCAGIRGPYAGAVLKVAEDGAMDAALVLHDVLAECPWIVTEEGRACITNYPVETRLGSFPSWRKHSDH